MWVRVPPLQPEGEFIMHLDRITDQIIKDKIKNEMTLNNLRHDLELFHDSTFDDDIEDFRPDEKKILNHIKSNINQKILFLEKEQLVIWEVAEIAIRHRAGERLSRPDRLKLLAYYNRDKSF